MNRLALALALLLLAAPAAAEPRSFSTRCKEGGEAAKLEQRDKVLTQVVEEALEAQGLSDAFRGGARQSLIRSCAGLLTKERLRERRGRWRYTVSIELDDVRKLIVKEQKGGIKGVKLLLAVQLTGRSDAEVKRLEPLVRGAAGEELTRAGAVLVEGDPKSPPAGSQILSLKIGVKFKPFAASQAQSKVFRGRLVSVGTSAQVYDPAASTINLRATLRSNLDKSRLEQSDRHELASLHIPKAGDVPGEEDRYYPHVAKWLVRGVVARFNASPGGDAGQKGQADERVRPLQLRLAGYSKAEIKRVSKALEAVGAEQIREIGKVGALHMFRFRAKGDVKAFGERLLAKAKVKGSVKADTRGIALTHPSYTPPKPAARAPYKAPYRAKTLQVRFKGFSPDEIASIQKQLESHEKVQKPRAMGKVRAYDVFSLTVLEEPKTLLEDVLAKANCKGSVKVSPMAVIVTK